MTENELTSEIARLKRSEEWLWRYINGLNQVIAKKQKSLLDAWSHLNTIENKSDHEKQVYTSIIEGINVDHNPISKEEIEELTKQHHVR